MPDFGSPTFTQSDGGNNTGTMPSWNGSAAPSTIDDAGRALQGALTREWNWRNYTITAGGSANVKTLTYSVAPQAYYNQRFSFIANVANTGTATLNVNGLGAKTIKKDIWGTLTDLSSGDMPTAVFVEVAFNTAADCFVWVNRGVVQSVAGVDGLQAALDGKADVSRGVPAGALSPFAGDTTPSGWLLCHGQAVSRTSFAGLFAALGTIYGIGDGSTTFNIPDMRGFVPAGRGNMGGTDGGRLVDTLTATTGAGSAVITGISNTAFLAVGMFVNGPNVPGGRFIVSIDSATQVTLNNGAGVLLGTQALRFGFLDSHQLGSSGGDDIHVLSVNQMPLHGHPFRQSQVNAGGASSDTSGGLMLNVSNQVNQAAFTGTPNASQQIGGTGGGQAHSNLQPTIILNYIIKT
jgi:microcystin-dependent protein